MLANFRAGISCYLKENNWQVCWIEGYVYIWMQPHMAGRNNEQGIFLNDIIRENNHHAGE